MASTTLDPIATKLAALVATLDYEGDAVKGYKWDPGLAGIDSVPAGLVGMPTVQRVPPDEAEDHLGATDWRVEYPVALVFDLSEAAHSQSQAVEIVEAFIKAVDADQTLTGSVIEAKVTDAEPEVVDDDARALLIYRCRVATLSFV